MFPNNELMNLVVETGHYPGRSWKHKQVYALIALYSRKLLLARFFYYYTVIYLLLYSYILHQQKISGCRSQRKRKCKTLFNSGVSLQPINTHTERKPSTFLSDGGWKKQISVSKSTTEVKSLELDHVLIIWSNLCVSEGVEISGNCIFFDFFFKFSSLFFFSSFLSLLIVTNPCLPGLEDELGVFNHLQGLSGRLLPEKRMLIRSLRGIRSLPA